MRRSKRAGRSPAPEARRPSYVPGNILREARGPKAALEGAGDYDAAGDGLSGWHARGAMSAGGDEQAAVSDQFWAGDDAAVVGCAIRFSDRVQADVKSEAVVVKEGRRRRNVEWR